MNDNLTNKERLVCTIGHSSRPIGEFIDLLLRNKVTRVIDVRTIPKSRHNPQFNQQDLEESLANAQISYTYLPTLGGLRQVRTDSINTGWRNLSFRGYADHMQSSEFMEGIECVLNLIHSERCALMCAEAVPWRCHRSLIGDALLIRGIQVEDIIGLKERKVHTLTSFARVNGTQITYPAVPVSDNKQSGSGK